MIVSDLILGAMLDLGILQEGEVPTPNQAASVFLRLDDWIDGIATLPLTKFAIARTTWTITSAMSYTVGVGGDINVARPVNPQDILDVGYINNNFPTPVEIIGLPLTDDVYDAIPIKTYSSPYPTDFYYKATFPLGTLIPYPIPSASLLLGVIYTRMSIPEFTAQSNTVSVPPGYRRYLRASLAAEIAPMFTADIPPELQRIIIEAEANIKRANIRLRDMPSDAVPMFHGGANSNIYTGP